MASATCPKCNAARKPGDLECPACGVIYARAEQAAAAERKRKMEEAQVRAQQVARQVQEQAIQEKPPPEPVATVQAAAREWTSSPEINAQIDALGAIDSFMTKKEIKYLPTVLRPNEKILAITSGFMDRKSWLMVVTDSRLLFLDKGIIGGLSQTDIHIKNISSISHSTGLLLGEIIVTASGAEKQIKNIAKQHVSGVAKIVTDLIHKRDLRQPVSATTQAPVVDTVSQLEKLAVLMEKGILTQEEFQAQKAKILQL